MEATVSKAEYDDLKAKYNALKHDFEELKRLVFGAKSERYTPEANAEQLALFGAEAGAESVPEQAQKEKVSYERRKRRKQPHPGRLPLPDHLPVDTVVIEPDVDTEGMVRIGQEVTRKVDYTPGRLSITEYIRPKYAPAKNATPEAEQLGVVIGEVPDQVLPKAIVGAGFLAHMEVSKFIDHLPFYRQREMFKRDHGWNIPASTMGGWHSGTCKTIEPLHEVLEKSVLATNYLQGDESRMPVLEVGEQETKNKSHRHPGKARKAHLGYMWVFRNPLNGNVLFSYRSGRGANILHDTLGEFKGHLQSDGYSGYTSFMKNHPGVKLISCLAHIRRKFYDALSNHQELADQALRNIQYLYRIERICKEYNVNHERRRQIRDRLARPKYEALLAWVKIKHSDYPPKSGIGKALGYAVNHLPRLAHYLEDGRIEIDNNQIENKIRPLALGRKNWLFAGSNKSAQQSAMMYSFFASCAAHDVNPREWLKDVLIRIGHHKPSKYEELLPANWKKWKAAAEATNTYTPDLAEV